MNVRRAVLFAGAVAAIAIVGASAGGALVDSPNAQPDAIHSIADGSDAGQLASVQPIDDGTLPVSLQGEVTTAPVHVGDRLLAGTDEGLYVFANGSLERYVDTGPVRSIAPVGDDRAIVLTRDDDFPNVLSVDLTTGTVRWTASRDRSVYSSDFGIAERQVPAFDAVSLDDVDGDGTTDVAVAVGGAVVGLDGASGEQLWTVEREYYVWRVARIGDTVYAGTQGGSVLGVDASDGDLSFARQVTDPFEHEDQRIGTVPQSVWSVEPITVDGTERLAVTTEDGTAALLDADDGTVIWQEEVFEFDREALTQYYRSSELSGVPTIPGDANFFNIELTVVDGGTKLAVSVNIDDQPQRRSYSAAITELHLLDAGSGEVDWSNEGIDLAGSVVFSPTVEDGSLLVPRPSAGTTQEIGVIDPDSGTGSDSIEISTVPDGSRGGSPAGEVFLSVSDDDIAVVSAGSDLRVVNESGSIDWSFPSLRSVAVTTADFTGDGREDPLLTSQNRYQRGGTQTRGIVLRSGTDGAVVWSTILGVEEFVADGGYDMLRTVPSPDGGTDLVAVRQPRQQSGGQSTAPTTILVLSGSDGTERFSHNLGDDDNPVRVRSIDVIGDVNGAGGQDLFVDHGSGAFVLDAGTGDIVAEFGGGPAGPPPEERRTRCDEIAERINQVNDDLQRVNGSLSDVEDEIQRVEDELEDDSLSDEEREDLERQRDELQGERDRLQDERNQLLDERATREAEREDLSCDDIGDAETGSNDLDELLRGDTSFLAVDGEDGRYLVAVSRQDSTIRVLSVDSSGDGLSFSTVRELSYEGDVSRTEHVTVGDLTGDGFEEIVFRIQEGDTGSSRVFAPGRGEFVGELGSANRLSVAPTTADFTGNGQPGTIVYEERGDESEVRAFDGTDRIWSHEIVPRYNTRAYAAGDRIMPAAAAGDVNGDGAAEVAVVESAGSGGSGSRVRLYDVASGELVDTIALGAWEDGHQDPVPGLLARRLPDQTGDGQPELGVVTFLGESPRQGVEFFVVDPAEGEVLIGGDGVRTDFADLGNGVGIVRADGGLRSIDVTEGISLSEPGSDSPLTVEWTFDGDAEYVSTVSVNDRPVAITREESATVNLPPGSHEITVRATSSDGITVYDTRTVTISGGSATIGALLYGATGLSVAVLFGIGFVPRLRRRVIR